MTGVGMETVEDAPAGRRGTRQRWLLIGAVAVAAMAGIWLVTAPDAIGTPGGTVAMQLEPGETRYVGYYSLSADELVVESIDPVTLNGLDTALWLCVPIPESGVIGVGGRADLDEHCRSVEPFGPGMVLAPRNADEGRNEPYLLVEVIPTSDQPQGMCGLDITYRAVDGWRTGRQRQGGDVQVTVNEPDDPDQLIEPEEELLAACRS
jgi:hypothetical protein